MGNRLEDIMKSAEVTEEAPVKESEGNDIMEKLSQYTEEDLKISRVLDPDGAEVMKEELSTALRMIKAGRALDYFVSLKSLEKLLEDLSKNMIPFANKAYVDGGASKTGSIRKYTPGRKWEYPVELVRELNIVKAKMKAAEKSGAARPVTQPFDPLKSKMFAVSL